MARLIGILILIALGSVIAGILCAFLLHNISQRFQKRRQALFQKNVNLIATETTKRPVGTTVISGITKQNGHKRDTLEILFKNHNNIVTFEKNRIPPKLNVEELKIINQKSIMIEGIPKKSPELNALQQQTIVDYKNTPASENQIESHQLGALKGPEIISHKEISMVRKPKKLSKGNASKEQETLKQKNTLAMEETNQSPVPDFSREPEIINPKRPYVAVRKNESSQSDIIKELETNLAIATTPWSDKLLPFQTSCWDSRSAEDEPLKTTYFEDLIQLYIDVGLANNIVWMATEFSHRSKELDESYMKLSASIAERIKHMMSLLNGIK
jgi:hypothetical protein